jgi:lipid II:glycine glycyltransferase (peptidoglycan interpeptide bridge formation enzyme)
VAGSVRLADGADLEQWDARTVDPPAGNVLQSRAWARHRERSGWTPHFVVVDDLPVLAFTRPWRLLGGSSGYISRGPIPAADVDSTATRLAAVVEWLGAQGADVVAADPEVPAETGFPSLLEAAGFRQIEEIQPTRHRLDLELPASGDEAAVFSGFSSTTRNLIRQAERQSLVVREVGGGAGGPAPAKAAVDAALETLYGMLLETSQRRRFWLAARSTFRSWLTEAIADRLAFILVVEAEDGEPIGAASFHRHGNRLTYALSGERTAARRDHPGATRLLLWEAIRIALREGRTLMDLSGVDVRGARRMPRKGEPEHGMLLFKESFGSRWVEMTGAHERVIRPGRYLAGRIADRVARLAGRASA